EGGVFHEGNIDSGCFLVQTDLARRGHWFDQQGYGTDYRYFTRLIERVGVEAVRFVPTVIGVHL
ncbi:MAG: hypothetical protein R3C01_11885, partial [Planctomycetaceae bacterium]